MKNKKQFQFGITRLGSKIWVSKECIRTKNALGLVSKDFLRKSMKQHGTSIKATETECYVRVCSIQDILQCQIMFQNFIYFFTQFDCSDMFPNVRESSGKFQKFLESFWVIENVPKSLRKYWTLEDNFDSVMFEVVLKYSTRFRPVKVTSFSEIFSKLKTEVQNFHKNSRMLHYFVVVDVETCSNSERFI